MDALSDVRLLELADHSRKVLLIGDVTLDIIKHCACAPPRTGTSAEIARMSVSYEQTTEYTAGGVIDLAKNIYSIGVDVDIVSCIGTKNNKILDCIKDDSIKLKGVISLDGYSVERSTKYVMNGVQIFHACKQACCSNVHDMEERILDRAKDLMEKTKYAALVILHTEGGIVTEGLVRNIIELSRDSNIRVLLRSRDCIKDWFQGVAILITDKQAALTYNNFKGKCMSRNPDRKDIARSLQKSLDVKETTFLLSKTNICYYSDVQGATDGATSRSMNMSLPKPTSDQSILENAVIAGLTFGATCELSFYQSCSLAATLCSTIDSAQRNTVVNIIDILPSNVINNRKEVITFKALLPKDRTLVVTTGCFDLLHAGHVDNLRRAKELGDVLIVLLNTDVSVRALKGPARPNYHQSERVMLLQSLRWVDFIILFDELEPSWYLRVLDPDVFVKGDEYSDERIMREFPFLKRYQSVPTYKSLSTTKTVQKIIDTMKH